MTSSKNSPNYRRILNQQLPDFFAQAQKQSQNQVSAQQQNEWNLSLEEGLLYDAEGLRLLWQALAQAPNDAQAVEFHLRVSDLAYRDFYCLQEHLIEPKVIKLKASAQRKKNQAVDSIAVLEIVLPESIVPMRLPSALVVNPTAQGRTLPRALLINWDSDFDLLFANQIALLASLQKQVRRSPSVWLNCLPYLAAGSAKLAARALRSYRQVHPSADVHPSAIIEGSVIEADARIGAQCVVRGSHVGRGARLMDGAKVELSIVGDHTWLMHDLVLYCSVTEEEVFLIHGPYQFSYFQSRSSAFATILMDYRPDGKPIQVKLGDRRRSFQGSFLGSVFKPDSKALGGVLLAPGRIVPEGVWLGPDPSAIHQLKSDVLKVQGVNFPQSFTSQERV
jgi:hypothetical protein